jgi:integrase/recombinase XerD
MKIKIVPVEETKPSNVEEKAELRFIEPVIAVPRSTNVTLEEIFIEFLQIEVGDGAASADTIRSYLSQTKQC